jgi:UbiD family decarboxylase
MSRSKDLREFLSALESIGDVEHIGRPVSTDLEAGAITRRSTEQRRPLPLFDDVEGVEPGFRLVGALGALSSDLSNPLARIALALGMPHDIATADLVARIADTRNLTLIPPRRIAKDGAPCKQNILLGEDATLDRFPIPVIHDGDGGAYANTWGIFVARTPDGRWTNWSITRVMKIDGQHMTGLVLPQQHIGVIWQEWEKLGKPMPFALFQGGDPGATVAGGMPIPAEVDEAAVLGALYGEPIDVVPCETVDLEVPAGAEVVIEGHLSATRDATEGPFAEFHGWAFPETTTEPLFTINAITYRDQPIWPLAASGRPADDSQVSPAVGISAELLGELHDAGLPIAAAWMPPETSDHWMIIIVPNDWRQTLPDTSTTEFVHRIGEVMSKSRAGRMCPVTYVLDDDIDPTNMSDVLWALGTRIHPVKRSEEWPGYILPWYPCYTEDEIHEGRGSTAIHDGLLAAAAGEGRAELATFDHAYPADIRQRVLDAETPWPPTVPR